MAKQDIVISIDAMGGDKSPKIVIEGIALAAKKNPDVKYLLFGDSAQVTPLLQKFPELQGKCELRHAPEMVHNEDKPSQVIRNRNTSMFMAIDAVKRGEAQAVVSAGNTGALMAISKLNLKTINKIHRPAIVSIMPHLYGRYIMLDLGANTECDAINLCEFAFMGEILAHRALGIKKPRVALLNIGSEEMKGREEIKLAAQMIKSSHLDMDFIGYIEPHDIQNGLADVIVADGFTGNIALKSIEGTAKQLIRMFKGAIKKSLLAKLGLLFMLPSLLKVRKIMDPRLYNGAMFIGLNGLSVKSHGGADAFSFSKSIENATHLIEQDFIPTIRQEVEKVDFDELQAVMYDVY